MNDDDERDLERFYGGPSGDTWTVFAILGCIAIYTVWGLVAVGLLLAIFRGLASLF